MNRIRLGLRGQSAIGRQISDDFAYFNCGRPNSGFSMPRRL
jgi:hypothetical protein